MSSYHKEQSETLSAVRQHLATLSSSEKQEFKAMAADYVSFREDSPKSVIISIFLNTDENLKIVTTDN
ncbi:MAG: hypothetical protein DRI57_30365 [Deltaproteobacteria bacterium]|nr:MAG: hypothetical protein DRI57_30365 [Deltaproteobacteria bacterium]